MAKKPRAENPVVGLVQMTCGPKPEANLKKAIARIGDAARDGATVVCLQELFRSQYFCQKEDVAFFALAEPIPGPTSEAVARVARQKKVVVVASFFERRAPGLYHNTAVVFDRDGSIAGTYRKMHIPDDPLYYEKFYFAPGDLGFRVHDTSAGRCGVLVCWDQWFPEGARLTALAGAQMLFYPTAIGWLAGEQAEMNAAQHQAWETMQRAHAIANGVYVVAVNRVGREGQLQFWGQSFVADPFGRIVARASADQEETLVVPIDLARIEETRQNWPFLRDRRIDAYGPLTERLIDPGVDRPMTATPAALGYTMPAEWHPHEATWLSWPKDPLTWPDRVPQVEAIFLRMIELLAGHETVNVLVDDEAAEAGVRARLVWPQAANVCLHRIPTVDAWIRDYGPNFLIGQPERLPPGAAPVAFNSWGFNAWGGKYETLMADTSVPRALEPILEMPRFAPGLVLEGGSIDVNGAGVVMTTEQCLLNPNRNPSLDRAQIEQALRDYLGVATVLWLGEGIEGDDTDGHIDDISRFVDPRTIVTALEDDPASPNFKPLQDNLRRLELAKDVHGRPYDIVALPMPGPVLADGEPLPASYANFYIANGVVLLPTYAHANDERARATLQTVFPTRCVEPIACEPLVWGMGAIHCVTQQQPQGT